MGRASEPPPTPDWRSAVRFRDDPALTEEIRGRFPLEGRPPPISVTDLLGLRRAYWRPLVPLPPVPPEREARLEAGRFLHRVVGPLLGPDAQLEIRVRKEGLVGRIDALTDVPVEVKSATLAVEPSALADDRPEYVEQLAMYCALLERPTGRLVTLVARETSVAGVRVVDLSFRDLPEVYEEMHRRADRLRSARGRGDPGDLGRCRWFSRGCEYREAEVCDCTGEEVDPPSRILACLASADDRPDLAGPLRERLEQALASTPSPSVDRFRDLVYPRRAYYARRPPPDSEPTPPRPPGPASSLYADLLEAVESGPVGEVARLPSRATDPAEEVGGFRGEPYVVRTSRVRVPHRADDLLARSPQYALELGFRCVATGRSVGRVIVAYEYAQDARDRVRVFEVEFRPVSVFARLWRGRLAELERALADRAPESLEACPSWMFESCPYRTACGCGPAGARSQR